MISLTNQWFPDIPCVNSEPGASAFKSLRGSNGTELKAIAAEGERRRAVTVFDVRLRKAPGWWKIRRTQRMGSRCDEQPETASSINNVLLVKIERPVTGIPSIIINQPTNGKRTSMSSIIQAFRALKSCPSPRRLRRFYVACTLPIPWISHSYFFEHAHRNSEFSQQKLWFSIAMFDQRLLQKAQRLSVVKRTSMCIAALQPVAWLRRSKDPQVVENQPWSCLMCLWCDDIDNIYNISYIIYNI